MRVGLPPEAQVYRVGGAVRDYFLGLTPVDHDFVVVGTTPAQMLAQGFIPVGRDFPVFLHPETKDAYALARTERKQGHGYHGFVFHADATVSLEADLARRDLTINAMAMSLDGQTLIDPYGGMADLQAKVLRHVAPAFVEDPLRVLRVARFAARWPDFVVVPETLALMRNMVNQGELAHLASERKWQEFSRGLLEPAPARMMALLAEVGALAALLPHAAKRWAQAQQDLLVNPTRRGQPLTTCFGLWAITVYSKAPSSDDVGEAELAADFAHWALPQGMLECARLALRYRGWTHPPCLADLKNPARVIALMRACDAFRRRDRWGHLVAIWRDAAQYRGASSEHLQALTEWELVMPKLATVSCELMSLAPSLRTDAQWQARLAYLEAHWL